MRYVSFSGGADSTALAIYLADKGEEFELLFVDTAAELPETYWIIPRVARALDKKLTVISGASFYQRLANWNFFLPGPRVRWCTRELKEKPTLAWAEKAQPEVLSIGIRADEAHRFERTPAHWAKLPYDRPLVEAGFAKRDAYRLCESRGLLNPCYDWRSNCSCFCCPFQRVSDWRNLLERHPDLYALAEEWERLSQEASENTRFQWNENISLGRLRDMAEAQLSLLAEPKETACAICAW